MGDRKRRPRRSLFTILTLTIAGITTTFLFLTNLLSSVRTSTGITFRGGLAAELDAFAHGSSRRSMDFRDEDMVADDKSVLQQVGGQQGNDGDVNDGSFSHADTRSTTPRLVMPGNFVDSPVTLKTHHIFLPTNTLGQKTARKLEKFTFRDPLVLPSNSSQKLPLEPLVEYRGVLLDAGRHYFPLPWIYNLIDYLHLLNMNLLHFRLTDDQAFNIRLDSRPELAQPAFGSGGQIYSPNQLRQLVDYAKSKGIIIMPEINVPGHAGAWAGSIPRIVVPCAGFICRKGYGIPLNITHPDLIPIIRDVMEEIKDVFSTTPFFHLGGDEIETSLDCFTDLGIEMYNYSKFEKDLEEILVEVGIDPSQVVRWETSRKLVPVANRTGGIDHYWLSRDYLKRSITTTGLKIFSSSGLYFDTNFDAMATAVYQQTTSMLEDRLPIKPTAVIAGTFELNVETWMNRNVVGRLLAVAMGTSKRPKMEEGDFKTRYKNYCNMLDLPKQMCLKAGGPLGDSSTFKSEKQDRYHEHWRKNLCYRLTETHEALLIRNGTKEIQLHWNVSTDRQHLACSDKNDERHASSLITTRYIPQHMTKYTGIIVDLVQGGSYSIGRVRQLKSLVDFLSKLRFSMIQLRVLTDAGMSLRLDRLRNLTFAPFKPYPIESIRDLVKYAKSRGINVVPEISVVHRAGGMFSAATMVPCPKHHLRGGGGYTVDVSVSSLIHVVSSLVEELDQEFDSPLLHLGYDERNESIVCLQEADMLEVDFEEFEGILTEELGKKCISVNKVLRWENEEQISYAGRLGSITHYHKGLPTPRNSTFPEETNYFLSTGLVLDEFKSGWDLYRHTQHLVSNYNPLGILASVSPFSDLVKFDIADMNLRQELMILAIALSKGNLDEPSFRKLLMEMCLSFKYEDCKEFGNPLQFNDKAKPVNRVRYEQQDFRMRLQCSIMAKPKAGVLVEDGVETTKMAGFVRLTSRTGQLSCNETS